MTKISSITSGPRQSNFELLRLLAMFLVLTVHTDFVSLGEPGAQQFDSDPMRAWTTSAVELIAIPCVNLFIMISGWFGIRTSWKGAANFLWQCVYFCIGIYIFGVCIGITQPGIKTLAQTFQLWFLYAYLGLYIFAPALNLLIKRSSCRQLGSTVAVMLVFQTAAWLMHSDTIHSGYSAFSFMILYLLARWLRLYGERLRRWGGWMYLAATALNLALYRLTLDYSVLAYCNPLVILQAASLTLFFANIRMRNSRFINWAARSAFAVYLLHTHLCVMGNYFAPWNKQIFHAFDGPACVGMLFLAMLGWYAAAILLDQPRRWLWTLMARRLFRPKA